jgi:diguanylate cyclase (GGDEF)-like protein/PAS domain S-box-containing protein
MARSKDDLQISYTELLAQSEKLDSANQMLTTLANSTEVCVYVRDYITGEILYVNDRFARYTGKESAELIGTECWKWHDEKSKDFCRSCPHNNLLDQNGSPRPEQVVEVHDPVSDTWQRATHQAINWMDGRLAHMVTMLDVTAVKKMQQQLAQYAYFDRSLHLPNGLRLLYDAEQWQGGAPVYLICYDIISLRTINDVYGRDVGDALLQATSQWIELMSVPGSCLYRIDGDLFAFVIPKMEAFTVKEFANAIYRRFEDPWPLTTAGGLKRSVYCGISMGVVCANSKLSEDEDLLTIIERTMSHAHNSGNIVVYGESMNVEYKEQLRLEVSLEECINSGMQGFSVCFQPIVEAATGRWCSLEALCRWTSPEFGTVSPLVFIHKAEQMGLITKIGNFVLENAIRSCKEMGLDVLPGFLLNVNLSPLQITDELLKSTVESLLKKYDYPGEKLSLEITESTEMSFTAHTIQTINQLKKSGVLMALDDFGTGYSNFNNLRRLPVSILKTERAFLQNIEQDSYLQHLFYLLVELAHAAGMIIIVEGVETEEQMQVMLKNGVDRMQGFLFSEPLSAEQVRQNLHKFVTQNLVYEELPPDYTETDGAPSGRGLSSQSHRVLGQAVSLLARGENPLAGLENMLGFIGRNQNLGRVWLYRRDGPMRTKKLIDWGGGDTHEMPGGLEDLKAAYAWLEMFGKTGIIAVTDSGDIPETLRADLSEGGVKAVMAFQLYYGGKLLGYLGFDDRKRHRQWSHEELALFEIISKTVSERLVILENLGHPVR